MLKDTRAQSDPRHARRNAIEHIERQSLEFMDLSGISPYVTPTHFSVYVGKPHLGP